jgi:hypothetical protein
MRAFAVGVAVDPVVSSTLILGKENHGPKCDVHRSISDCDAIVSVDNVVIFEEDIRCSSGIKTWRRNRSELVVRREPENIPSLWRYAPNHQVMARRIRRKTTCVLNGKDWSVINLQIDE